MINTAATAWDGAFAAWQAEQTTYKSLFGVKDGTRDAATVVIRRINKTAQAFAGISDTVLSAAGLPVHKNQPHPGS